MVVTGSRISAPDLPTVQSLDTTCGNRSATTARVTINQLAAHVAEILGIDYSLSLQPSAAVPLAALCRAGGPLIAGRPVGMLDTAIGVQGGALVQISIGNLADQIAEILGLSATFHPPSGLSVASEYDGPIMQIGM